MVITMAKLRMAHASTYGARKPPGPIQIGLCGVGSGDGGAIGWVLAFTSVGFKFG